MTAPAGDCDAGFYCVSNEVTARPETKACTEGEKCPAGTETAIDCPIGYYQNNAQSHDCFPCPQGFYCTLGATEPTICAAGHYCPPLTGVTDGEQCSTGTYQPDTGAHFCLSCDPGKYCG